MPLIKSLEQRGDTIVEVLLAVAILGLIIAGSYSIASRGLRSIRQAQEHAEALKIAEGQVERLKARAITNPGDIFGRGTGFCLGADTTVHNITSPSPTASTPDDFSRYTANCQFTLENQPCDSAAGYCYYAGIREGNSPDANTFTVTVRWNSIGSSQQDQVELNYRVHP